MTIWWIDSTSSPLYSGQFSFYGCISVTSFSDSTLQGGFTVFLFEDESFIAVYGDADDPFAFDSLVIISPPL